MSVEKISYRSLAHLSIAKLLGDTLKLGSGLSHALGRGFDDLADAAFVFEFDAARRYQALTDVDLGVAMGEPSRYACDSDAELSEASEDDA